MQKFRYLGILGNCSCIAPALLYLLHLCSRKSAIFNAVSDWFNPSKWL